MPSSRELLRKLVPLPVRTQINRARLSLYHWRNRSKSTAQVFDDIYASGIWGGKAGELRSGNGSRGPTISQYAEVVAGALKAGGARSILDIGCGDFVVAGELLARLDASVDYVGVDVSSLVIDQNSRLHARDNVRFIAADAVVDHLPMADAVLIRQVLQHLSNAQIRTICSKLSGYRQIIVTEHYPPADAQFSPNLDKPQGSDTRVPKGSAVVLDAPPFNMIGVRKLFEVPANLDDASWGRLVTVIIEA